MPLSFDILSKSVRMLGEILGSFAILYAEMHFHDSA